MGEKEEKEEEGEKEEEEEEEEGEMNKEQRDLRAEVTCPSVTTETLASPRL